MITAMDWLKIDVVNHFGMDKLSFEDRIKFFDAGFDINKADDPIQCYAAMKAYEEAKKGKPIGWGVTLDATSSGLQFLSAMCHDHNGAYLSNITSDNRSDAYTSLYLGIKDKVPSLTRNEMKDAIMTSLYGSEKVPEKYFGNDVHVFYEHMNNEVPDVWKLNLLFQDLWNPNRDHFYWIMPDGFEVYKPIERRITKSFHFRNEYFEYYKYEQGAKKKGKSIGPDVIHSVDSFVVRELVRRCNYSQDVVHRVLDVLGGGSRYYGTSKDEYKAEQFVELYEATGILSYGVLDVINKNTVDMFSSKDIVKMLKDMPTKAFPILPTHDSVKVHPNYVNDLRNQYKQIMHQIIESNLLEYFLIWLTGNKDLKLTIPNRIKVEDAHCTYAIC